MKSSRYSVRQMLSNAHKPLRSVRHLQDDRRLRGNRGTMLPRITAHETLEASGRVARAIQIRVPRTVGRIEPHAKKYRLFCRWCYDDRPDATGENCRITSLLCVSQGADSRVDPSEQLRHGTARQVDLNVAFSFHELQISRIRRRTLGRASIVARSFSLHPC